MEVLVLSNGKLEAKEIENTLEELQKIVGGYIEIPFLSEVFNNNEIDVIINDEGKFIDGLKPEIAVIYGETGRVLDVVYGNCIFASHDDEGNTTALTEEQKKVVMKELKTEVILTYEDGKKTFAKALFI